MAAPHLAAATGKDCLAGPLKPTEDERGGADHHPDALVLRRLRGCHLRERAGVTSDRGDGDNTRTREQRRRV